MLYILVKRGKDAYYILVDPSGKVGDICRILGRLIGNDPQDIQLFLNNQPLDADYGIFDLAMDERSSVTYKLRTVVGHDAEMQPVYEYV
ncbi:hypothetical protein GL50803_009219 [Giardia duodenalis]|uniref:Uncharacterized protein n=1 Tax=Giardia intestinalis (strain ATCC 50803 / WB clone C6) TaxID=184922 RepID=A8BIA8_GIAIC|nr:hypothetical protein GL50803_009219 [Giardia intestinalis]KAE8305670.1 hypothetical protein GL50803_009219 [Giardia intestinalis]|eukprot:XP_001706803.1 Hypothetical protein GL50803_9219 [Giardia lamblia ATCC 50803]